MSQGTSHCMSFTRKTTYQSSFTVWAIHYSCYITRSNRDSINVCPPINPTLKDYLSLINWSIDNCVMYIENEREIASNF